MKLNRYKIKRDGAYSLLVKNSKNKGFGEVEYLEYIVNHFCNTLSDNCENFDETLFLKNFVNTSFNVKDIAAEEESISKFSFKYGRINKVKTNTTLGLLKSLMDLASTSTKNVEFDYLKEPYTQILINRYFSDIEQYYSSDFFDIMKMIELIIGKDCLEEEYFKGNFDNALNKLYLYESEERINKLLFFTKRFSSLKYKTKNDYILKMDLLNRIYTIMHSCIDKKNAMKFGKQKIKEIN